MSPVLRRLGVTLRRRTAVDHEVLAAEAAGARWLAGHDANGTLARIEDTLRRNGQPISGDGLPIDLERALISARATPTAAQREQLERIDAVLRQHDHVITGDLIDDVARALDLGAGYARAHRRMADQADRFEAELIAVDAALASAGATPATDRVDGIRAVMDQRDALGADLGALDRALDAGEHEYVVDAAARVRLERDTDRATSRALARRVAWLEGDRGDIDPDAPVALRTADGDDAPTELRALARELHRWAPDVNALAIRDRMLDVAWLLDRHPSGAAARDRARRLVDAARRQDVAPDGVVDARIVDALDRWDGTLPPGRWVCDACGAPIPCPEHQPDAHAAALADGPWGELGWMLHDDERDQVTRAMTAAGDPGPVLATEAGRLGVLVWTATRVYGCQDGEPVVTVPRHPQCATDLDGAVCVRPGGHTEPCRPAEPVPDPRGPVATTLTAQCDAHPFGVRCALVAGHPGRHTSAGMT